MGTADFDRKAADWDNDPEKVHRAEQVAAAVLARVPVGPTTRLLEYGAGTGLVSQALRLHVGPMVLADNSGGMRQVIQQKIAAGVLPQATIWSLDLEQEAPPREEFDLVLTSMVLHHVHDLPKVLDGFAALLAPGGHLGIADLDREDGSFHQADFDGHHGFDRSELAEALQTAGFTAVSIADCTSITKEGQEYSVFLASAQR